MDSLFQYRKQYYAGFICSVCSPAFTKNLFEENGQYTLEINQFMCQGIVKKNIDALTHNYIYNYIQELINLTYCVRNNSKKEIYNYEDGDEKWENNVLFFFDPHKFPNFLRTRRKCLEIENAFTMESVDGVKCNEYCENDLGLFDLSAFYMDPIIKIENDLHQMFYSFSKPEDAKERLEKNLSVYNKRKQEMIDKGALRIPTSKKAAAITLLKVNPENFKKIKYSIVMHLGANFQSTPMNMKYFKFMSIVSSFLVFIILVLYS
jgi:hypothetical protein